MRYRFDISLHFHFVFCMSYFLYAKKFKEVSALKYCLPSSVQSRDIDFCLITLVISGIHCETLNVPVHYWSLLWMEDLEPRCLYTLHVFYCFLSHQSQTCVFISTLSIFCLVTWSTNSPSQFIRILLKPHTTCILTMALLASLYFYKGGFTTFHNKVETTPSQGRGPSVPDGRRGGFVFIRRNVPSGEANTEAFLYYSGIRGIRPILSCHTASSRLVLLVQKG